ENEENSNNYVKFHELSSEFSSQYPNIRPIINLIDEKLKEQELALSKTTSTLLLNDIFNISKESKNII
ncbi:11093_t:CDS:1, partial [Dentiscutata heterogama]